MNETDPGHGPQAPNPASAINLFARTSIGLGVCGLYGAGVGVILALPFWLIGFDRPPMKMEPGFFYFLLFLPGTAVARYLLTCPWNLRRKLRNIDNLYKEGLITRLQKSEARQKIMQFYTVSNFPSPKPDLPPDPLRQPEGFVG